MGFIIFHKHIQYILFGHKENQQQIKSKHHDVYQVIQFLFKTLPKLHKTFNKDTPIPFFSSSTEDIL